MSTPATVLRARSARPVRSPRHPARTSRRKPALRVVDTEAQRRARRVRRVLAGLCAMVVCSLVAAVGFHVVVAQSQLQLDRLEQDVAAEQDHYQDLRVLIAGLSSPERITTRAEALGLAPSDGPPGVVGVPADPASPAPAPPDASGGTVAESWPKVKPHLDPR